jgi:phosphoribosylaminoimidazolecarboxamide formyltransferase / IMP cyclohydrolase
VIVKHTNPCGIATREDLCEAYRLAVRADPISAFGGIVAFNRPVDDKLAREIREFRSPTDNETRMFYEIVIAPSYTPEVGVCAHPHCMYEFLPAGDIIARHLQ